MRTIYKYPIEIKDTQTIGIPAEANIVHVGLDPQGVPCLWAEVDTQRPWEQVTLHVRGTGHPLSEVARKHVGSFQQGPFVWHVFI